MRRPGLSGERSLACESEAARRTGEPVRLEWEFPAEREAGEGGAGVCGVPLP